jgi:hypothetical protein
VSVSESESESESENDSDRDIESDSEQQPGRKQDKPPETQFHDALPSRIMKLGYWWVARSRSRDQQCSSMRVYQPGAATSIGVTGQSGQSKLHTVGEHLPGGPCDRRFGRLVRTTGRQLRQLHCATTGPGAAWLGTGGEAGPGTGVKPVRATAARGPERTRMAGVC